jgi:putative sigma-54 modulation protein
MATRISGHQVKITRELRTYIESKLPRIEKYAADKIQNLEITVEKDSYKYRVELRMKAGSLEIGAHQKDADPIKAIDLLMDKSERLLKKKTEMLRGKIKHIKEVNRQAKKADHNPDTNPLPLIEAKGPTLGDGHSNSETREMPLVHEKLNIRIFRNAQGKTGRMTVHQAAEELYHRDENFLCFRDSTTDSINILYRRKDGHFAIMEPDTF